MSKQPDETTPVVVTDLHNLYKAYDLLRVSDSVSMRIAASHTKDGIRERIATAMRDDLPTTLLIDIFFSAPSTLLADALLGKGPYELECLLDRLTPEFDSLTNIPNQYRFADEISSQALDALIARGFPFTRIYSEEHRSLLCMTRGEEIGAKGWSKSASPGVVYLNRHGLRTPAEVIHPDGIRLLAEASAMVDDDTYPFMGLRLAHTTYRKRTDWRLYLAMFAANPEPADFLREKITDTVFKEPAFVRSIKKLLFHETQSNHEVLAKQAWLTKGISAEDILAMPLQPIPKSVEDVFGPAPKFMKSTSRA